MTNLLHFLLLALASSSALAENAIRFAGSTAGAQPLWTPPRLDIEDYSTSGILIRGASCSNAPDAQPRVVFTANFATPGLRSFTALGARMAVQFLIYDNNWNTYSACNNLVYARGYPGGYRYVVADPKVDFMYFNATTYYFVITGGFASWSADGGYYAVNIEPMNGTGDVSSVATWRPPLISDDQFGFSYAYDCTQDNTIAYTNFTRYTWTQEVAGKFDIYLFLDPPAWTDLDSTFVLYQGTPTDAALFSDSCNTGAPFLISRRFQFYYAGAMIPSVNLLAGVVYSLVFSNSEASHWGVRIVPTRVAQLVPFGFTQPSRQNGGVCEPSSVVNSSYYSLQISSAVQKVYLFSITQWLGTYSDYYYVFVYNGAISIPLHTCTPTTSLLFDDNSFNSFAVVGSNITVVIVPGSQNTNINVPILINVLTGDQLGSYNPPTSGTFASTTGVASASSSSSGKISASSTSATSISSSSSTSATASLSTAASTTGSTTPRPTTPRPTTRKPTTHKPTTRKPTTRKPTTRKPTTRKPTTRKPTTSKPIPQA